MSELVTKLGAVVRHNRFTMVAVLAVAVVMFWLGGCQSTTKSPINQEKVTRTELVAQADKFAADLARAYADLDQQDAFKAKIAEMGVAVASGNEINPVGAALSLLGILGIGVAVDNRVKDSVIKAKSNALENINGGTTTT